jgi:nucleoid DNA-binding protein
MKIDLDEVYKKVSFETGIPKSKVEMAFKSIFENVANTMREKNGDNILLPKFGKFVVPNFKLKYINVEKHDKEVSRNSRGLEKLN